MLAFLKRLYPVRALAHILDFHFQKMERLFVRLDDLDRLSRQIQDQLYETGQAIQRGQPQEQSDNSALLQGLIFSVERVEALHERMTRESLRAAAARNEIAALLERLQIALDALSADRAELGTGIPRLIRWESVAKSGDFDLENPDVALLAYLCASLLRRTALAVGANTGSVSERLLDAGYEVCAFEPHPARFGKLAARLDGRPGFRAREVAIGPADGTMDLRFPPDVADIGGYGPADLCHSRAPNPTAEDPKSSDRTPVQVRTLDSLRRSHEIPDAVGLLKIDTGAFTLDMLRGMVELASDVVMTEFRDRRLAFGRAATANHLDTIVDHMRGCGYGSHVVLYRVGDGPVSYYCHHRASVPDSWGHVVFFKDRTLFREALEWCSWVLPVTYFR